MWTLYVFLGYELSFKKKNNYQTISSMVESISQAEDTFVKIDDSLTAKITKDIILGLGFIFFVIKTAFINFSSN